MGMLASLRAELAADLATVSGLKVYPYLPGKVVETPGVVIALRSIDYDTTGSRGTDLVRFELVLLVARIDDERAQEKVDALLDKVGTSSIKEAVEADGDRTDRILTGVNRIGSTDWAGTTYLGAFIDLEVYV